MSSSKLSQRAARRRGELHRAKADRQTAYTVAAHRSLSGRSWINGQEVGGTDRRYRHLEHAYD
jgi:hypothetical protein